MGAPKNASIWKTNRGVSFLFRFLFQGMRLGISFLSRRIFSIPQQPSALEHAVQQFKDQAQVTRNMERILNRKGNDLFLRLAVAHADL